MFTDKSFGISYLEVILQNSVSDKLIALTDRNLRYFKVLHYPTRVRNTNWRYVLLSSELCIYKSCYFHHFLTHIHHFVTTNTSCNP